VARAIGIGTLLAGVALWSSPAMAGKRAGVSMPDTIDVAGRKVFLNGLGVREATIFNVDVYVAGLYLEHPSKDPKAILASEEIKVIHMRFVRDVDRSDILSAYRDGFKRNAGGALQALQPRINRLLSWLPAFKDGGTLTVTYVPGQGTYVAVNGKQMGIIEGADFGRAMFAIWLGSRPPNGGLKSGLLGR
jgi:hypothetical protein